MEQLSGDLQQQEQPPPHLKCPRCNSQDTKFRYYNNKKITQPRYFCRTCRRQWTAGGIVRNIPNGVNHRVVSMVPQNFHTTTIQPPTNHPPPEQAFPQGSGYFNDNIYCLDIIQSLNQHVNAGNQFSSGGYSGSHSHLHNNTFVQPAYPMNSMTQGGVSTSNTSLRNNFRGNTTDEEIDEISVNVDEWLNLPDDSP